MGWGWGEGKDQRRLKETERVYYFTKAAIMKYDRLGGLTNRSLFSDSTGGWKSEIKLLVGLISPEASILGMWMAVSLCPHIFCACLCPNLLLL